MTGRRCAQSFSNYGSNSSPSMSSFVPLFFFKCVGWGGRGGWGVVLTLPTVSGLSLFLVLTLWLILYPQCWAVNRSSHTGCDLSRIPSCLRTSESSESASHDDGEPRPELPLTLSQRISGARGAVWVLKQKRYRSSDQTSGSYLLTLYFLYNFCFYFHT